MKLSIITINYNNAAGLQRTINSVLEQKNNNFEYIVVDGASTDGGVEIIEKHKNKIDICISEPDTGIYNAMNKGIVKAKGDYLLFMNSGDEINSKIDFNTIIHELASGEDFIFFNIETRETDQTYIRTYPDKLDYLFFIVNTIPHQATFIKREKLLNYGCYNEQNKIASDWAYFLDAICLLNQSYKYVKRHFSIFYVDAISAQKSNLPIAMQEQRKHIEIYYNKLYSLFEPLDELGYKRITLNNLRKSKSVIILKKLGFLKWFNHANE